MIIAAILIVEVFLGPHPAMAMQQCDSTSSQVSGTSLPYLRVIERLDCERTQLADALERAQMTLRARAATEAPSLLPRIQVDPPRPRPSGYGLLPKSIPNEPVKSVPLTESRFSLEAVATTMEVELRNGALLTERGGAADQPLEQLVGELERLRKQLDYLESSISYHRFWQKSAAESVAFFEYRNALVARARALHVLEQSSPGSDKARALRRALAADVAPLRPTPGLTWIIEKDGTVALGVRVVTDIEDDAFLARLDDAVKTTWNAADAAQSRSFKVRLHLTRITPDQLYPEGGPARGSDVDEARHIARFPKAALVLTTGAKSTHARTGRYVQLGTAPVSQRTLAHEFGHLLGFDDGYLRGTEGTAGDPFGFVFVEWTGILDNLMGAPSVGRVTGEMIDQLITAYSPLRE